ncbi:MAG TPA: hypothetical protein VK437_14935 [Steroidobacteraceae bacterium]|nr:hypothetical protein [Steroidobacteraceae bacterium]
MTELDQYRAALYGAYASVRMAAQACEHLAVMREAVLPKLIAHHRRENGEHKASAFADSLHVREPALAKLLLEPLSGTVLGKLIVDHAREISSRAYTS